MSCEKRWCDGDSHIASCPEFKALNAENFTMSPGAKPTDVAKGRVIITGAYLRARELAAVKKALVAAAELVAGYTICSESYRRMWERRILALDPEGVLDA